MTCGARAVAALQAGWMTEQLLLQANGLAGYLDDSSCACACPSCPGPYGPYPSDSTAGPQPRNTAGG